MTARFRRLPVPAIAFAVALQCWIALPAVAQITVTPPNTGPTMPPGVHQEGAFSLAPVRIDGTTVFRLAILQENQRAQHDAQFAVATRAQFAQAAIAQVLAEKADGSGTEFDPDSLKIAIASDKADRVLSAVDRSHPKPLPIVKVTQDDARLAAVSVDVLAKQWQDALQAALVKALQRRQPEEYARSATIALWVFVGLLIATAVLALAYWLLRRRIGELRELAERSNAEIQKTKADASGEESNDVRRDRFVAAVSHGFEPLARLRMVRTGLQTILWLGASLWLIGILVILTQFPSTMPLAFDLIERIVAIVAILVVASVVNRLADVGIQRFALAWSRGGVDADERTRRMLRAPSIISALGSTKALVVFFVAGLATLSQFGFSSISVLAVGGIAAVALSLSAQNLVQDFVCGMFVLIEDQYAAGDTVVIAGFEGLVEALTLRVVQLRDFQGSLITIPHGQAKIVANETRGWSRVDYRITVTVASEADPALAVLRSTVEGMMSDPDWHVDVRELEWVGIQSVSGMGIVLRARVRTAPGAQWRVGRELQRRVIAALRDAKIDLGIDPAVPVSSTPVSPTPVSPPGA